MARLTYTHPMTGVRIPRNEVLNSRPWAMVKLTGFIIAVIAVLGAFLLCGAMLAGARINFHAPAVVVPTSATPTSPVVVPALVPPAPAPTPPVTAQIVPALAPPAPTPAPASSDEALEQAYKAKLLTEGENP